MKKILLLVAMLGTLASCVKDEAYVPKPTIASITLTPSIVAAAATAVVSATITSTASDGSTISITSAKLFYKAASGSENSVSMSASGTTYSGTIPASVNVASAVVSYYIVATNASGKSTTTTSANYTVGQAPPDYSQLVVNEVDGTQKFVEIYNKSNKIIDLTGVVIMKNEVTYATILQGNSIAANGFAVVGASGNQSFTNNVTVAETTGGMSDKQTLLIELKSPTGTIVNTFQRGTSPWGATITAVANSYARIPDGTGDFKVTAPTPGAANPTSGGTEIPQS